MRRLIDPWFAAAFYAGISTSGWWHEHPKRRPFQMSESQGLFLWCPCGYGLLDKEGKERYPLDLSLNLGRPHGLLIPFANPPNGVPVPSDHGPTSRDAQSRPRWVVSGSSLNDLTLTPSIAVGKNPECWHGFITNGEVT